MTIVFPFHCLNELLPQDFVIQGWLESVDQNEELFITEVELAHIKT